MAQIDKPQFLKVLAKNNKILYYISVRQWPIHSDAGDKTLNQGVVELKGRIVISKKVPPRPSLGGTFLLRWS